MRKDGDGGRTKLTLKVHAAVPGADVPGAVLLSDAPQALACDLFDAYRATILFASYSGGAWGYTAPLRALEDRLLRSRGNLAFTQPLGVLAGELAEPKETCRRTVSRSCLAIADWALSEGHTETALAFAEAAALCSPEDGRLSYAVGRIFKSHGRARKAESWLRRASRLAYYIKDWESHTLCLNSLGMLYWDQGANPRSKASLHRARRYAKRYAFRRLEGVVLHNLFVVSCTSGDFSNVEEYAQGAFERYLPNFYRLPALAYDIAYYWLIRGYALRALPVFQSLISHFPVPGQRIQVLAALARAAGAAGDEAAFNSAWAEVHSFRSDARVRQTLSASLIDVGFGACHLGDWARARLCLTEAMQAAEAFGQTDMLIKAEAALEDVKLGRNPDVTVRPKGATSSNEAAEELASRCVGALAAFNDPVDCIGLEGGAWA
jgi:tetratricopeptide (TPR) repeat protein